VALAKPVKWVGSSRKDVQAMPEDAKDEIGFALARAQEGKAHPNIKPLTGLPGVHEIVANIDTDTYRLVYVVNLSDATYVLHAFKKKSKRGTATPKKDMDVIRRRLRTAQEASNERDP
jgi:phage-related protein